MAYKNSGEGTDTKRTGKTEMIRIIPLKEKVEYELRYLLRAYPEDYARIMAEFKAFVERFE